MIFAILMEKNTLCFIYYDECIFSDSVKVHAYYDKNFPRIYLNISWTYPVKGIFFFCLPYMKNNFNNIIGIPFGVNITKLNTGKCPGVSEYSTNMTVNT